MSKPQSFHPSEARQAMVEIKIKKSGTRPMPRGLVHTARFMAMGSMIAALSSQGAAIMPRSPYTIALSNVAYSAARDTVPEKVCIWFDRADEWWEVSPRFERHVREKDMNTDEEIYQKPSTQMFVFSTVEATIISKVCKSLVKTLDGFDHDLKNGRWDRCLFLDSYLASFFHEFFYLYTICRASPKSLPPVARIADSLYDRSPESPKSDKRIMQWRQTADHIIKLRIATKELIYQIKQWQKKELDQPEKTSWEDDAADFVQAYELFLRLYFNLPPQ
jgi:hypothetical protein